MNSSPLQVWVWRCDEPSCGFELPVTDDELVTKWRAHRALHETGVGISELEVPAKTEEDHPQDPKGLLLTDH